MAQDYSLTEGQKRQLRRYPQDARKLPAYPESFRYDEIGLGNDALAAFAHSGLLECLEDKRSEPKVWRVVEGTTAYVEERVYDGTRTPCERSAGVRCLESGRWYTCTDDDCDCRFEKEIAEAVVYDDPLPDHARHTPLEVGSNA